MEEDLLGQLGHEPGKYIHSDQIMTWDIAVCSLIAKTHSHCTRSTDGSNTITCTI